jgi:AcrR family transcriptional regulator
MAATASPRRSYHHGDLRRSLIDVALAHVRRGGLEHFSLREAAREAGVTVGAIYKHFADREALLAEAALEGFVRLAAVTANATAKTHGEARLLAVGQAYVSFASQDPHLFRLMFSRLGMQRARSPLGDGMRGAFDQLRSAIAEVLNLAAKDVDDDLLAMAWSIAHGSSSLISDGVWKPNDKRAEIAMRRLVALLVIERR